MPALRRITTAAITALVLAGSAPASVADSSARSLPTTVIVHDSRTSAPVVDIAQVRLDASWYWDAEQDVRITVPGGLQPGHRVTVWFDLNADSIPDGHVELDLTAPKHAGGRSLQKVQEFRVGGGWTHGGTRTSCTGSEGGPPVAGQVRRGQRSLAVYLDLWSCLKQAIPLGTSSGAWRAAVSVAKGRSEDMAPNHHGWSATVAGWGPCDPSGGSCP